MRTELKRIKGSFQNPIFTLFVINAILLGLIIYIKLCDSGFAIGIEIGKLLAK